MEADREEGDYDPSDEGIRSSVEKLLEIRRDSRAGRPLDPIVAASFAALASRMFCQLMRPIANTLKVKIDSEDYAGLPIEKLRVMIADALTYGFPLPNGIGGYLACALEDLNAGYSDELLVKTPGRHGVVPHILAETKLKLSMWIRYQHGLGRKVALAQAEVAAKVNRTHEAVAKWPIEAAQVYGDEKVRSLLKCAMLIGRSERMSGSCASDADDDGTLEWSEALCMLERDLDQLANTFNAAVTMRQADLREESKVIKSGR
jgi:hypothetical protein